MVRGVRACYGPGTAADKPLFTPSTTRWACWIPDRVEPPDSANGGSKAGLVAPG